MPYIKMDSRNMNTKKHPLTAGELNWAITDQVDNYLKENGLSYKTINDIVGALECAKIEFYRRIAAKYEDTKITENGDMY